MGYDVDIERLVKGYGEEKRADSRVNAVEILFPHLAELKDSDVRDFYNALAEKGYRVNALSTVEEVKHFAETYKIITRCVLEEFISF